MAQRANAWWLPPAKRIGMGIRSARWNEHDLSMGQFSEPRIRELWHQPMLPGIGERT